MTDPSRKRMLARCLTNFFAVLGGSILIGCNDATEPERPSVTVSISPEARGPSATTLDGEPLLKCEVIFEARASGRTDRTAVWHELVADWFMGPERREPVFSDTLSAHEVREAWGGPAIEGGETRLSLWEFFAAVPFSVSGAFLYSDPTKRIVASAPFHFSCGPELPRAGAAPPVLENVTVAPLDNLQPGDTIRVSFTGSSEMGLWKVGVATTGAFESQREIDASFAKYRDFTMQIVVPGGVPLGSRASVWAFLVDAALQTAEQGPWTTSPLVDVTPPGFFQFLSAVRYGVGDTLSVTVHANDNHAVDSYIYELGPPASWRDTVSLNGVTTVATPVPPEWLGNSTLTAYVTDQAGNESEPYTEPLPLHVFPVLERPTESTIFYGYHTDAVLDERRGLLYIMHESQAQVEIVSVSPLATSTPIQLGADGLGMDLTPGGDTLVIALPGERALALVDLNAPDAPAKRLALTAIDTTMNHRPTTLRITGDGRAMIGLMSDRADGGRILELDLVTGQQRIRSEATDGLGTGSGTSLVRSRDRSLLLIRTLGKMRAYDADLDAFGPLVVQPQGKASVDDEGQTVLVRDQVLSRDLSPRGSISLFQNENYLNGAVAPDGSRLFIQIAKGFYRFDAAGLELIDRVNAEHAYGHLFFADGGRSLLTTSNTVADQHQATEIRKIELW